MNEDFDYCMKRILEKMEEDKEKVRPCELCNKSDLPTFVVSSSLGPMSNNICICCSAMGAEMPGMTDLFGDYMTYSFSTDDYNVKNVNYQIQIRDGKSFKTRSEFVNYYKASQQNEH